MSHFYRFGEFSVDAEERVLLLDGKPVPLRPKVFDTLLIMVERSGRIVGKDELMNRLWPDCFVEEDNLTFNIRQLRKTLGDDARWPRYIETVTRRGYRFIAEVEEVTTEVGPPVDEIKVPTDSLNVSERSNLLPASLAGILLLGSAIWGGWHFRESSNARQNRHVNATEQHLSATGPKIEKLTASGKNRHAAISLDGKYVAYTIEVKGRVSIWLRQLGTGSVRELISFTEGYIYGMGFAHNGEQLYFVKGHPEPTALYRISMPLGGVPTKLISKPEGTFAISRDDRQVAFVRYSEDDKECALMLAATDGSNERVLARHIQPDRFNTPTWSPDGQTVAVATGPSDSGNQNVRIVEYNVADGSENEVSRERWFHVSRLISLPDRRGLLVVGEKEPGTSRALWRISYPGGQVNRLTDGLVDYVDVSITANADKGVATEVSFTSDIWIGPAHAANDLRRVTHAVRGFSWTPDGRIIYSSHANADRNLWAMQLDGTDQKQLTAEGQNLNPTITADGRYIVFVSNRGGAFQIWRMNADGSNQVQLTNTTGAGDPAVSPDGRWIVYHAVEDWSLWKVPIEGGTPLALSNSYCVSPSLSQDGKLIACVGKSEKKHRRLLILPIEGGSPLRVFDPAPLKLASHRLQWDGDSVLFAGSHDGVTSLYKQSVGGGRPEKLFDFSEDDVFDFSYSPKRHHLAAIRSAWRFDIVLLSDLNQ